MAAVAKLGSLDRVGCSFQSSQPPKFQSSSSSFSFRPTQQFGGSSSSAGPSCHGDHGNSHGNSGWRVAKRDPFRAMALPIDRRSAGDGSESVVQEEEEAESGAEEPWLGAVVFRRSGQKSHYELNTSLERLGLGRLSTASSRALANSMGLQSVSSAAPAAEECTPVSISIDVSRDDDTRDLRLDGIARTTITLCCNRCLSPVVERVFANFNLLLTETPVLEPTQQRLGVVLGDNGPEDGVPELELDLDDKLHFPREAKEIDLSKYLRDSVHLEIPYKSLCSIQCAGLCQTCGVNLNERSCDCKDVYVKPSWGPLEQLRRQMKDEGGLQ